MARSVELFAGSSSSASIAGLPFERLVESYVRYYASGQGHTARAKRVDLQHFINFLTSFRGVGRPQKLKVSDWDFSAVQRFLEDRLARGESPATVARRLATLKHMGRTLAEKVAGFVNPAREARAPKLTTGRPQALTAAELRAVRAKARQRLEEKPSFIRRRNHLLLTFLLDTGLRADEVRLLKRGQFDDQLEWIRNVRTKGRRYRNVYVTSEIRADLRTYLDDRARELKRFYARLSPAQDRALPLFISTYRAEPGTPDSFLMGAKSIWRGVHELTAGTSLHPHLLRHTYALDLLDSSNDIRLVAQALGHSDVRITMRYTERKDQEIARALERSRKRRR